VAAPKPSSIASSQPAASFLSCDACKLTLAPHKGKAPIDREIVRLQQRINQSADPSRELERLGWLFVSKARTSHDPGFYKLAEQCALCLEAQSPKSPEALLLRGHALHSLHRFKEAETLARALVGARGLSFDYGLLGDVLMEQGHLTEAAEAYQKMVDLRPDLHAYTRIAHLRWLKGDLSGALDLIKVAAGAASPRDAESAAWVYSRLALYQFQAGEYTNALASSRMSLSYLPDYAPALLAKGRVLLADEKFAEAITPLQRAASLNPLPEYQWAFAEALRGAGRNDEAGVLENKIQQRGALSDPRTFSLFLATRSEKLPLALRLAEQELAVRADVFTHDAMAWSLAAAGRLTEAQQHIERALAEGTQDARLFFHSGVIATKLGHRDEAQHHFAKACALQQMLLPSERNQLAEHLATAQTGKEIFPGDRESATSGTAALSSLGSQSKGNKNH
jgi:tetratricopeptide (TPR) repeat protein